MDYRFEKHFTLEEANSLIPAVQRLLAHVHAVLSTSAETVQSKSANGNGNGNGSHNGNGHSGKAGGAGEAKPDYSHLTWEERKAAASELLSGLELKGIVIQDFTRGLIDFPSIRDGEEVFLCYELADGDSIQFYHEIEAGYAGRHPL